MKYTVIFAVNLFLVLFIAGCETSKPENQNSRANQNSEINQIPQQKQNSQESTNAQTTDSADTEVCAKDFRCDCGEGAGDAGKGIFGDECTKPCRCTRILADKPILVTGGSFQWESLGATEPLSDWRRTSDGFELLPPAGTHAGREIREVIIGLGFRNSNPDIDNSSHFFSWSKYTFSGTAKVKVSFEYPRGAETKQNWISTYPSETALVLHSGGKKFDDYDEKEPKRFKDKSPGDGPKVRKVVLITNTDITQMLPDGQVIILYPANTSIEHSPIPGNDFLVRVRYNQ